MKKEIFSYVTFCSMLLAMAVVGYYLGMKDGEEKAVHTKAEISAIYSLMEGISVGIRTNMNLAAQTAHYIKHSPPPAQGGFTVAECAECLKVYELYVKRMPKQPGYNGWYFEEFYKKPIEQRVEEYNKK